LLEKVSRHLSKMSTGIHQPFQLKRPFWIGRITNCKLPYGSSLYSSFRMASILSLRSRGCNWTQRDNIQQVFTAGRSYSFCTKTAILLSCHFHSAAWIVNSMRNGSSYPRCAQP
jgi:hypothetical protein